MPNGEPNPNTHAYGYFSLRTEVHVEDTDEPAAPGNDIQVETREQHNEARLQRRHALALKRARQSAQVDISDDDGEAELHGEDLASAERAAAARRGASGRLNAAIDDLLTQMNVPRPFSPPPKMPPATISQRAGKDK